MDTKLNTCASCVVRLIVWTLAWCCIQEQTQLYLIVFIWLNFTTCYAFDIVAGKYHNCVLLESNSIKCWGSCSYGELGLGDTRWRGSSANEGNRTNDMSDNLLEVNLGTNFTVMGNNLLTVDLGSGFHVIQIAAGTRHNCALSQSNALKCWGYNRYGQLGLGDISNRGDNANEMGNNLLVVDLGTDFNVTRIAGGYHNCAVSQSNAIKCWGYNKYGQLGLGDSNARGNRTNDMSDNLLEVNLGTNFTVTQIVAGQYHTCVLSQYSTIKCWGCNKYGQLGLGTNS
eukprot:552648_1